MYLAVPLTVSLKLTLVHF